MLNRIRIALGLTAMMLLFSTYAAFAKGSFAFISVSGEGLDSDIVLRDARVTQDWFAFADLQHSIAPPTNAPQGGYVITRYYMDGGSKSAFDRLHYYPRAGLVYYEGIVNGWSSYDRKWYQARPGIQAIFEWDVQAAAMQEALRHAAFIRRS